MLTREPYPLQWPHGRPRTPASDRKRGNLNKMPGSRVRKLINQELTKMGVSSYVITTNVAIRRDGMPYVGQTVADPGTVVYFIRDGKEIAIGCDAWISLDANIRAVGLMLEAINGMERWGGQKMQEQTIQSFTALPESIITAPPKRDWQIVLGVNDIVWSSLDVKQAYRKLSAMYHPDNKMTGDNTKFLEVQRAYEEWQKHGHSNA